MYGIHEIRRLNGTESRWTHRLIVQVNGSYYYEELDGTRTLCPWSKENESSRDTTAESSNHGTT